MMILLFSLAAMGKDTCMGRHGIYNHCLPQKKIFDQNRQLALKNKQMMLIEVGATWCVWCISLSKLLKKEIPKNFNSQVRITELALYKGRKRIKETYSLLKELLKTSKNKIKIDAIPMMILYNPKTEVSYFINTAPLEKNTETTKGHDTNKVLDVIKKGLKKIQDKNVL